MADGLRDRLGQVRERIERAAVRAGRRPEEVTLIAVSKTFDATVIQAAVDAGLREFGENKVQEAAGKVGLVHGDGLKWHLIGHLQSNKARLAVRTFHVVQTVDTADLAHRLDRIAAEEQRRLEVLVQVDLAHEATKSGASEDELDEVIAALDECGNLDFTGLMTLPPFFPDPTMARPFFSRLREIRDRLNRDRGEARKLTGLSMGMSNDYEVAIEEGATMVRVGTALFGAR